MIYLVSNSQELFDCDLYKRISVEESLRLLKEVNILQYDSETKKRDPHLGTLLCIQFGSKEKDFQIVVDCTTIHVTLYKEILENTYLVGHNLKFDLQWLYNYNIIPRKVYDTMIVEQMLFLNYPRGIKTYNLRDVAWERLGIDVDKSVRGKINYLGLAPEVIVYAANDVVPLEDLMWKQLEDCEKYNCKAGAKLECDAVPWVAYLEWCGIKLDEDRWKIKMQKDAQNLENAKKEINEWFINKFLNNSTMKKYISINLQGDLFLGYDTAPKCTLNWDSSQQVIEVCKLLGFNTVITDKESGENKDTVLEKHLTTQKGIDDEFLKLYFTYKGYSKVVSTYGQGHLNAINPITGRLSTNYWQIGAISSRMSSGGGNNEDIAKYKKLPVKEVPNVNMQQLPHDKETRACFVAEKGNLFCSCDYAAAEARMGAEIYNEKILLDEFLYGSGDTHSAYAKQVWPEELEGIDVKDIKKKRPDLRSKVKSVEFAVQFGSDGTAAAPAIGCTVEEARVLVKNLLEGMKGLARYKKESSSLVRKLGYIIIHPLTGHRLWWYGYDKWKREQESYTKEFWEEYKAHHKGTGDEIAQEVRHHFQEASLYDRYSLNVPTQGGCAIVIKDACITWFNWVVDNGYFGKIKLCNVTHDEMNTEFPEELKDTYPKMVSQMMQDAAAKYFYKLPIPAEPEVDTCWRH